MARANRYAISRYSGLNMTLRILWVAGLILSASVASGQTIELAPVCSMHPTASRSTVLAARSAGVGLREQRLRELKERADKEGILVENVGAQVGGGDCASISTPHGRAANAVSALLYDGQPHCSAVLVSPSMAVTAAHCIRGFDINRLEFVVGSDVARPIQRSTIYSADVHSQYDEGRLGVSDLAYVYLNYRITEADPVTLAAARLPSTTTRSLLHVGFGIAGPVAGAKRCVEIPIHDVCTDTFSHAMKNLNTCNGDSGGGVFLSNGPDVVWVGTTAWGDEQCAEFGVNMDVGAHRDWIKARMSEAPWPLQPARVENSARTVINATPEEVLRRIRQRPLEATRTFNDVYRGRWVQWAGTVLSIEPRDQDAFPGACNLIARATGNVDLMLRHYPDGCDLTPEAKVEFSGRLSQLLPLAMLELALIEPSRGRGPAAASAEPEPVGTFALVSVTAEERTARERRSRDVRHESRRGSRSGRVTECVPITVDAPWRLDMEAPIRFAPAHVNSAGVAGEPQAKTDSGFCMPFWAEGTGGAQVLGVTVDVGGLGVISGTVEYGVMRNERVQTRSEVLRSVIRADKPTTIAFPAPGAYELVVKLKDGEERVLTSTTQVDGVTFEWRTDGIQVTPGR